MNRTMAIVLAVVVVLFITSWIVKTIAYDGDILEGFLVTFAAFLTLSIMSFLYKDNPFYKFAEHLFVGVSAAF